MLEETNFDFDLETDEVDVDFEALDTSLMANDRYWSPVRKDDLGAFGPAEMITAAANFLDIGDVGNSDWMDARRLPFRDDELDEIGVTGRLIMRYAYEDHPDNEYAVRPYDMLEGAAAEETYEKTWLDQDPSVKWAILEANKLLELEAPTDEQSSRLQDLVQFIMEARQYNERQYEEQFVAVPEWAIDALAYSVEAGLEFDPQILPEPNQTSALKSKPISFAPLPSPTDIRKYYDIYEPEDIEISNREWCFRIKDGVKEYGPYGNKSSKITIYRSPNRDQAYECKAYRETSTLAWLHQHGFTVTTGDDGELNIDYKQEITPENLNEMTKIYGEMAQDISTAASVCNSLFTKRDQIEKHLKKEAFIEISNKIPTTHPHQDTQISVLSYLQLQTGKKKWDLSWEDAKDNLSPELCEELVKKITTKIDTRTYLLQIRSKTGFDTVQITKSDELAKEWKLAKPEDIPYFMGDPQTRQKLGRPSSFKPDHYDSLPDEDKKAYDVLHDSCVEAWLEETGLSRQRLQSLIMGFNSSHKMKLIPSRIERETGWLLDDLPATTAQLGLQRQALAMLGDKIVKCRIALTRNDEDRKTAFRKLQGALKARILKGNLTKGSLEKIIEGELALSYQFRKLPVPKESAQVQRLITQGTLYSTEQHQDNYVDVLVETNKTFLNHAEVFSIVPNFKPNAEVKKMAAIALEKELYLR